MTNNITPTQALKEILKVDLSYGQENLLIACEKMKDIATQALAPQECDVDVTKCKFYNDHDANVAECDEILDDRFLPIHTCEERICVRKCKYFDDDKYRGEICLADRKMIDDYGEEWEYPLCKNNPNCYYKQLHSRQELTNQIIDYCLELYSEGAPVEELLNRMFNEILALRRKKKECG